MVTERSGSFAIKTDLQSVEYRAVGTALPVSQGCFNRAAQAGPDPAGHAFFHTDITGNPGGNTGITYYLQHWFGPAGEDRAVTGRGKEIGNTSPYSLGTVLGSDDERPQTGGLGFYVLKAERTGSETGVEVKRNNVPGNTCQFRNKSQQGSNAYTSDDKGD